MGLDATNYYSEMADFEYMSVSQFKDFVGTYGRRGCEAQAMAKLRREYEPDKSTALLVGSYVDTYFEGTNNLFKAEHPEIFRADGQLRADYARADEIIKRVERDPLFMRYMSGEKQVIMTGEIFGTPWKVKIDSYFEGKAIVDLKVMSSITEFKYVRDANDKLDFIRYWGYDIQGAVYQEVVRQNTGKTLPFYIAAVSKEKHPNMLVIRVNPECLREAMSLVERRLPRVMRVKTGEEEAERCETCDYCRDTRVLTSPVDIDDLIMYADL